MKGAKKRINSKRHIAYLLQTKTSRAIHICRVCSNRDQGKGKHYADTVATCSERAHGLWMK